MKWLQHFLAVEKIVLDCDVTKDYLEINDAAQELLGKLRARLCPADKTMLAQRNAAFKDTHCASKKKSQPK